MADRCSVTKLNFKTQNNVQQQKGIPYTHQHTESLSNNLKFQPPRKSHILYCLAHLIASQLMTSAHPIDQHAQAITSLPCCCFFRVISVQKSSHTRGKEQAEVKGISVLSPKVCLIFPNLNICTLYQKSQFSRHVCAHICLDLITGKRVGRHTSSSGLNSSQSDQPGTR